MLLIYSYPNVSTPLATDVLVSTHTTLNSWKDEKMSSKSLAFFYDLAYVVIRSVKRYNRIWYNKYSTYVYAK